jgi:flagellar hook-associated protein 3 FlgL
LNNPSQLNNLQATLGTQTAQVQTQLAQVGSQFLRVQNMQSQNTSNGLTMKQNLSSIEDADIAEVMVNLQAQQVAYQAALQATAKAIQPSLTDFLR